MMTIRTRASRSARLGALVVAGALALAACAGSTGDADPTESASESTDDGDGGDALAGSSFSMGVPITESGDSPYTLIADAYMAAFPDREIVVNELPNDGFAQALRTQLQAGNADDVIYVTPGGGNPQALLPFAEAGFLEPLTGTSAEGTIPESNLPAFELNGDIWAQGLDLTVIASVSNKTAMEADGYTIPATFSDLLAACADLPEGKSAYVVAGSMPPNTGLTSMVMAGLFVYQPEPDWNAKRVAGEVTFADSQGWKDALNAILDMNEAGCFQAGVEGGDFAAITNALGTGTSYSAFIPSGAAFGLAAEVPDTTFTVDAFPGVTAEDTIIFASVNNALALTKDAENKDAALAFLDWLAQPENLKTYSAGSGNLPLGPLTAADLPPAFAPIADYLADERYLPLPSQDWTNGEVYTNLGVGIQGLFTGQTTVDAVLASMDEAWGN